MKIPPLVLWLLSCLTTLSLASSASCKGGGDEEVVDLAKAAGPPMRFSWILVKEPEPGRLDSDTERFFEVWYELDIDEDVCLVDRMFSDKLFSTTGPPPRLMPNSALQVVNSDGTIVLLLAEYDPNPYHAKFLSSTGMAVGCFSKGDTVFRKLKVSLPFYCEPGQSAVGSRGHDFVPPSFAPQWTRSEPAGGTDDSKGATPELPELVVAVGYILPSELHYTRWVVTATGEYVRRLREPNRIASGPGPVAIQRLLVSPKRKVAALVNRVVQGGNSEDLFFCHMPFDVFDEIHYSPVE